MSGTDKLKELNRQLGLMLDDPHPGLSNLLLEMADYAGYGEISKQIEEGNKLKEVCQRAISREHGLGGIKMDWYSKEPDSAWQRAEIVINEIQEALQLKAD